MWPNYFRLRRTIWRKVLKILSKKSGIPYYDINYVLNEYVKPKGRVPSPKFKNPIETYSRYHASLVRNFQKMQSKIKSVIKYKCESSFWSKRCRGGEVVAYVLFYGNKPEQAIRVCPTFFKESRGSQNSTILHELSHLAAFTDHYDGTIFSDRGLLASSNDAYLFEQFMSGDILRKLLVNSFAHMFRMPR